MPRIIQTDKFTYKQTHTIFNMCFCITKAIGNTFKIFCAHKLQYDNKFSKVHGVCTDKCKFVFPVVYHAHYFNIRVIRKYMVSLFCTGFISVIRSVSFSFFTTVILNKCTPHYSQIYFCLVIVLYSFIALALFSFYYPINTLYCILFCL